MRKFLLYFQRGGRVWGRASSQRVGYSAAGFWNVLFGREVQPQSQLAVDAWLRQFIGAADPSPRRTIDRAQSGRGAEPQGAKVHGYPA